MAHHAWCRSTFDPFEDPANCVRAARPPNAELFIPNVSFTSVGAHGSLNGNPQPFEDAVEAYHVNCLSRLPPDDPRWAHPLARRLRPDVEFLRKHHRARKRRVVFDAAALRAREDLTPDEFEYVEAFAKGAVACGVAATREAKKSHYAGISAANLAVVAVLRDKRAVRQRAALAERQRALAVDVGFTDAIRAAVGWAGDGLPDDCPSAAHLGSPDCPGRARALRAFFEGRSLSPRGVLRSVDKDKDRIRKALGDDGFREIIAARYPRLVPYPHIIEALAKRAQLDHVFSCACDHPMNLFLESDVLNSSFSDYNIMALKAAMYTPPVMRAAGDWVRAAFSAQVDVVSVAAEA